jgi:hypothetical protein
MFGNKDNNAKVEKLQGPKETPTLVQNYLINTTKLNPTLARIFKSVVRKNDDGQKSYDIRIYDEGDATARKIRVKDYTSLDENPNLIIYEGKYDETTKKVELTEKKKPGQDTPIMTLDQIKEKIEALTKPGEIIFIYMARGPANGGPLGRGCAIVECTSPIEGKKVKKYTISTADVVDGQPAGKGDRLFDSDESKKVAVWIKDAHHERLY